MTRTALAGLTLVAIVAAGAGGYWVGQHGVVLPGSSIPPPASMNAAGQTLTVASGPIIYYRDPDGRPAYSLDPRKTDDGRDFLPVRASEDVSFEDRPPVPALSAADATPKKILYYRNPMGLPDTSLVPKKDSMGMDYIPVHEGEDEDGSIVKIALGKLQRTGVRSETASERAILRRVRVPGTVQPDERSVSVVAVPADSFVGIVEKVTTGDKVRKGQPLLELRSADIATAAVQLLITPGYEGSHRRLANLGVPEEVIAEIERTRKVPPAFRWPAPRDGVVLERNATEGMRMSAGEVLFRIADLSTVWVLADVPEYDLASIAPGQSATVRIRSLPGRTFEGRVALIYPQVAKETRTTKVRIEIPNPDGVLRPDMYADVEIAAGSGSLVVAVPDSAVIDTGTRQVVILDKGDGRFEPRDVTTGLQGDGYTEIRNGIASGDRVVVSANFLIDAESNLKAALRGMAKVEETP